MELIYPPLFSYDFDNEQQLFPRIWWFLLTESYCVVRSKNGIFKYYSDKFRATKCYHLTFVYGKYETVQRKRNKERRGQIESRKGQDKKKVKQKKK